MKKSRFNELHIVAILWEGEAGVLVGDIARKRGIEVPRLLSSEGP